MTRMRAKMVLFGLAGFVFAVWGARTVSYAQSGGIGGTGISAYGPIQRFGSIFVNGAEYPLPDAMITIDGRRAPRTALRIGQVVFVRADIQSGHTRTVSVRVRHAVQGPVARAGRSGLTVLGQHIEVSRDLIVHTGLGAVGTTVLRQGDVVRVSGLPLGPDRWRAIRVTRLYLAGHLPSVYPVMLRGVLSSTSAHTVGISGEPFVWSGAPVRAQSMIGRPVVAVGQVRHGSVEITQMHPDALNLGPVGTQVDMVGYLYHRGSEWYENGVVVRFKHQEPRAGLTSIRGVVGPHGEVFGASVQTISWSVIPDIGQEPSQVHRPPMPERPEIERPEIGRPEIELPEVSH